MSKRKQIVLSEKLAGEVEKRADKMGLNQSELIRTTLARELMGERDET